MPKRAIPLHWQSHLSFFPASTSSHHVISAPSPSAVRSP
ncbi:hypothetical protein CGMCC3_g3416 [Colletotrichum fructicola]|nr:uncharacterized protein CGMCC3_g3416 [Colletotrichum fructicola]KAE9580696.1 hypothetical protein CGMCC3_g3416 [Colletotrichum fructicola]